MSPAPPRRGTEPRVQSAPEPRARLLAPQPVSLEGPPFSPRQPVPPPAPPAPDPRSPGLRVSRLNENVSCSSCAPTAPPSAPVAFRRNLNSASGPTGPWRARRQLSSTGLCPPRGRAQFSSRARSSGRVPSHPQGPGLPSGPTRPGSSRTAAQLAARGSGSTGRECGLWGPPFSAAPGGRGACAAPEGEASTQGEAELQDGARGGGHTSSEPPMPAEPRPAKA